MVGRTNPPSRTTCACSAHFSFFSSCCFPRAAQNVLTVLSRCRLSASARLAKAEGGEDIQERGKLADNRPRGDDPKPDPHAPDVAAPDGDDLLTSELERRVN